MTTRQPHIASYAERKVILDEIKSKSADYSWMWKEGATVRIHEIDFDKLRSYVDPERPYFFGELSSGILFAGDARDFPAVLHAIYPHCNSTLINGLIAEVGDKGGQIIDIGTNIGVVASSLARHVGDKGHVYAFEPSPDTFKIAAATIALNDLHNVTLTEAAIGDLDGEITFHATPGNSAIASAQRHDFPFLNEWAEIVVPSRKLDSLIETEGLDNVTLIKIDVEGHEMNVLRGARETIQRFKPKVVYEYTPVAVSAQGWSADESIALLESLLPFAFDALIEPALDIATSGARRVSFPLPEDVQDQVNVFAKPRS